MTLTRSRFAAAASGEPARKISRKNAGEGVRHAADEVLQDPLPPLQKTNPMDGNYNELGVRIIGEPRLPPLGHEVASNTRISSSNGARWSIEKYPAPCTSEAPKGSVSTSRGTSHVDDHHEKWVKRVKARVKRGRLPKFFTPNRASPARSRPRSRPKP